MKLSVMIGWHPCHSIGSLDTWDTLENGLLMSQSGTCSSKMNERRGMLISDFSYNASDIDNINNYKRKSTVKLYRIKHTAPRLSKTNFLPNRT